MVPGIPPSMLAPSFLQAARFPLMGIAAAASLLSASAPALAASACVTFQPPLVLGTVFGTPAGQMPGTVIFTSNGIRVSAEKFFTAPGSSFFNLARIEVPPVAFASGPSMRHNNINLRFRFQRLPFVSRNVTLSYLDLGGIENLGVNGSVPFIGDIASAPVLLGATSVSVTRAPVQGGKRGVVTLKGPAIRDLTIGGQELWIDTVCARP
jgi:hypothetical protein